MESQHVKAINTDARSKKRIKFASAKERSKRASADVYRSHKRKIGATSATTREEAVHNPHRQLKDHKRHRTHHIPVDDTSRAAVLRLSKDDDDVQANDSDDEMQLEVSTSLASELDETLDRNASEIFGRFHRDLWPLVRSLPEILHHADKIIDLMLSHMLSPASFPERPSEIPFSRDDPTTDSPRFIVNLATSDILHLMAVLARDLRHEIHPHVHSKIFPRLIQDLLNPPPPPPESGKQPIPLDVTMVESTFRCMSYILQYDAKLLLDDMETMRKYYGATLGSRRELVRRLAAESFAPLIRKIKNPNDRHRHLKRVFKALAATEGQPVTPALRRVQSDASDGISKLVFQLVRGVPGRLHSQGLPTVVFVLNYCTSHISKSVQEGERGILVSLASTFLDRLCRFVDESSVRIVASKLTTILRTSLSKFVEKSESDYQVTLHALAMLTQIAEFRSGTALANEAAQSLADDIFGALDQLFHEKCFLKMSPEQCLESLKLICPIYISLQTSNKFSRRLESNLKKAFQLDKDLNESQVSSIRNMTVLLAKDLIPYLAQQSSLAVVGSITLRSAARVSNIDRHASLLTVFSLASKQIENVNNDGEGEDDVMKFYSLVNDVNSADYNVSGSVKEALMDSCFIDADEPWTVDLVEKLGIALRCVSFVVKLSHEGETDANRAEYNAKAMKWVGVILNAAEKAKLTTGAELTNNDLTIIKSLALVAMTRIASTGMGNAGNSSRIVKGLRQALPLAENLLFSEPKSLWAMLGIASFVSTLTQNGLELSRHVDDVFEILSPNLASPSHALRLHTLQILSSYPKKNYITNHADLDLQDDLDEETSFRPPTGGTETRQGLTGKCDIIDTMLQIESARVQLSAERQLLGLVSRIEVIGRGGSLPVSYAEAAAHHMLGLFYVKFAPVWPAVSKALVSLLEGQGNVAWPALEAKLVAVMQAPLANSSNTDAIQETDKIIGYQEHRAACLGWERSLGRNIAVFGDAREAQHGEVLRHLITDDDTFMESVWEVAERCPLLVAQHSRVIVPTFLGFLSDQYFRLHPDDPIARELNFSTTKSLLSGETSEYDVQKRLLCFLRLFAAIDGPQQLVNHQTLEKVFRSFLTHKEPSVAQLSLSSLLKFKPKYLIPYRDILRGTLDKGQLRPALLKLQEMFESGKVASEHREQLVPIVSRILFGKLSVRESRSSKDSPAARRAAILSCLSVVCKDDTELFSFIYLMTRSFIPRDEVMKEMEEYTSDERIEKMNSLCRINPTSLKILPSGVIEGFLHLLQTVVAHLGHRITPYIPHVTTVILALSKFVAVGKHTKDEDELSEENSEVYLGTNSGLRFGAIRTLCYQRLAEIFVQFCRAVDFSEFGKDLWDAIGGSIELLPEMVVKTDRAPALLCMLEKLSTEPSLLPILHMSDSAVCGVIKCIAATSRDSVMQVSLSFVENLLEASGELAGRKQMTENIPLLLKQFSARLKPNNNDHNDNKEKSATTSKARLRQSTWRRELRILCGVSELISEDDRAVLTNSTATLKELSELLLPFLEPGQGTSDEDKLNVIGILKSTIRSLDAPTTRTVFESISNSLAPVKARPGIESLEVRSQICATILMLGENNPSLRAVTETMPKLSKVNSKRVDEIDFETVIPELNKLGKEDGWTSLGHSDPFLLIPVVGTCFHYLHNEDGVLARASAHALKTLVTVASQQLGVRNEWGKFIESSVVPLTRSGLQSKDASIRRQYVLIVRELARGFAGNKSPNLCGDLSILLNEENTDLDFFASITHVQIHRRARAFQRLRKSLNNEGKGVEISSQSLSSILLPLALHPVYESKTKAEEAFALEGIATVGAISRLLPWNKYNNTLWSILTSFDRHPEQEKYLVGVLCAIIDSFSFDLVGTAGNDAAEKSSVWRTLERRVIPKVENLLTKEKTDKNGSRLKIIRPSIVLALLKLFQKFPTAFFESKLPHILAVLCNALKSRDSDARDLARNTISKVVTSMDLKYLADVIREVAITLNEGYKLHVRAAVIHTILSDMLSVHRPPKPESFADSPRSSFDACIAALMDVLQEDLFGVANERRESQETNVRYIKEAGGSKSVNSIEMICRMIRFDPTLASRETDYESSIHYVISPLLERLRLPNIDASTIRKVKEILMRVAIGLAHNPSVGAKDLFPFVYATIHPFIGSQIEPSDQDDDDDEEEGALKVSGGSRSTGKASKHQQGKVVEWRPSTLKSAQSTKAAFSKQKHERSELRRVQDGANAPKLTGSGRHSALDAASVRGLNDPATTSAVVFGLNLLYSCLKKLNLSDEEQLIAMVDPFVPLLTTCICNCRDTEVALVSMKCLMSFLRFNLPSLPKCAKALGRQTLTFLTSSGTSLNQNHDMTQACFKTLAYLINTDSGSNANNGTKSIRDAAGLSGAEGEHVLATNTAMPLNSEQMKILIELIVVSVAESDQHNPALSLIKAILSRRFMSPELYDLMETMLKLNVRSHKAALRQQSGGIFIRYLLDYPMGEEKFAQHLKKVVANISYEYQAGRMSGILLLTAVVEKLPDELLERHAQLIFLPTVVQLVNDDAKECREAIQKCLVALLSRSSTEVLKSFHEYTVRWSQNDGPLKVASLQVFGIYIESCTSFLKTYDHVSSWLIRLQELLQTTNAEEWEIGYFSLLCIEKLCQQNELKGTLEQHTGLWSCIVERLVDAHPWIKKSSSRIVQTILVSPDTKKTKDNGNEQNDASNSNAVVSTVLEASPGLLFEIIRNLCFQLGLDEAEQSEELSELAIKTLTFALPIMRERPDLCFAPDNIHAGLGRDPSAWLMRRLSEIAKPKGRERRMGIFKCFAALCTRHQSLVAPHMELMLEPLHRSDIEARNEKEEDIVMKSTLGGAGSDGAVPEQVVTEASLARDVLQLVEESCAESPEQFLTAYAAVKSRAREKKEQRKVHEKAEAVQDPIAFAKKKIKKHEQEKQRVKRRVEDRRRDRGAQKKRRSSG